MLLLSVSTCAGAKNSKLALYDRYDKCSNQSMQKSEHSAMIAWQCSNYPSRHATKDMNVLFWRLVMETPQGCYSALHDMTTSMVYCTIS